MKNTMRKAMLSTIAMLVVAVMSLTGVTYAWFTAGNVAQVDGMQMNVTTSTGGIEVSVDDGKTWGTTVTYNPEMLAVKPVSSANAVNFYDIDYNPADGTEIKTKAADNVTGSVLTKSIQLRNTGTEKVTVDLTGTTILSAEHATTKTSKANLVKAARMAIINGSNTDIYSPDSTDTEYVAINGITNDYFKAYTGTHQTATATVNTVALDDITIELPANSTPVTITVVFWLEGQDAECIDANAGGAFAINLDFTKVQ
ncbi:MAG: hypothetical protein E7642_01930 [Ruminococcaceae bacterium]|nr:hypothetical protein [Oscillospiraceae bacterium]